MARPRSTYFMTVVQKRIALAMQARGDRVQDIAAFFHVNPGRISEIKRKWPALQPIDPDDVALPPPGPYPSPSALFELFALNAAIATEGFRQRIAAVESRIHALEATRVNNS